MKMDVFHVFVIFFLSNTQNNVVYCIWKQPKIPQNHKNAILFLAHIFVLTMCEGREGWIV